MADKPRYEELEQRIKELEKETINTKKAKEALQVSENKYRTLVNEIGDGIYITNDKGTIIFANRALAEISGHKTPDEIIGLTIEEFISPDAIDEVMGLFKKAIETGKPPERLEIPIIRRDGSNAFIELKLSRVLKKIR